MPGAEHELFDGGLLACTGLNEHLALADRRPFAIAGDRTASVLSVSTTDAVATSTMKLQASLPFARSRSAGSASTSATVLMGPHRMSAARNFPIQNSDAFDFSSGTMISSSAAR